MAKNVREITVFMASPNDLAPERSKFRETIDLLNDSGFCEKKGVRFKSRGWEDLPPITGRRSQDVINLEVDKCDIFILALHRMWGQPAPDSKYSSYTEEEFNRALKRFNKSKSPEIMIFFKNVDAASMADPGRQLEKVIEFKKKLRSKRNIITSNFQTDVDFGKKIGTDLQDFLQGKYKAIDRELRGIKFSKKKIKDLDQSEKKVKEEIKTAESKRRKTDNKKKPVNQFKPDLSMVIAEKEELAIARGAIDAAKNGRLQDAAILFAKATQTTNNLSIISVAIDFYLEIKDTQSANNLIRRKSALTNDRSFAAERYLSLLPLGHMASLQNNAMEQMLIGTEPEIADMVRGIQKELQEEGIWDKYFFDSTVRHYSTPEIMAMAEYLSTAEGQSSLLKTNDVVMEAMAFGQFAFLKKLSVKTETDFAMLCKSLGVNFDVKGKEFNEFLLKQ